MATKTLEQCIYTDARLIPYDGTNPFKVGTSMCTGCGIRVNSESGEPVEGVTCPINNRAQTGAVAETAQENLAQLQATVDKKVEDALAEERTRIENEHNAELKSAQEAVETAKTEAQAEIEALKAAHAKELKVQADKFEDDLKEINDKHAKELAAAKAPPKQ